MAAAAARALCLGGQAVAIAALPARSRLVVYAGGRKKRQERQRKGDDRSKVGRGHLPSRAAAAAAEAARAGGAVT